MDRTNYFSKFFYLYERYGLLKIADYAKNRLIYEIEKNVLKKRFITRKIHNYQMILDVNDRGISRDLVFFGTREVDHKVILEEELKTGMVALDLGANIGYYAIMECKLVGPTGFVYCIEPHPTNFEQLKKNIKLNNLENNVELHQLGGSNVSSVEKMYVSAKSNQHSLCDTRAEENIQNLSGDQATIDVKTTTISDFRRGRKNIDFIRMDIEGFEIEVFEGMLPALDEDESFRPSILFETHKPKYREPDHSLRKMLGELFARGYVVKILISDELPRAKFKDFGYKPDRLISTDGLTRGLYYNMKHEDVIKFSCDIGSVRGLFLQHQSKLKTK
jgi:FkbM family methyltransferase